MIEWVGLFKQTTCPTLPIIHDTLQLLAPLVCLFVIFAEGSIGIKELSDDEATSGSQQLLPLICLLQSTKYPALLVVVGRLRRGADISLSNTLTIIVQVVVDLVISVYCEVNDGL